MAGPRARTSRAAALHRRAAATALAAADILDDTRPVPADHGRQYELAERLRAAAAVLAPGWAGAALETLAPTVPAGDGPPSFVRVGTAAPLDDARFPALVPLFGTGHLTVDADARDPRVAGLLRAVLLRLLAATPAGALLVRAVDATGGVLAPFAALGDAGLLPPPATDVAGLRAVLTEAEQWVAPARADAAGTTVRCCWWSRRCPSRPAPRTWHGSRRWPSRARRPGCTWSSPAGPPTTVPAADATPAPDARARRGRVPLPRATAIAVRTAYALLGDPPGASYAGPGAEPPGGLNSPVFIEPDPSAELVDAVCRRLAARWRPVPAWRWPTCCPLRRSSCGRRIATDGITTTVGDADGRPVSLGFTELTPHWLVSGRSGAGRSTFLTTALLGLAARYGPEDLALYLVDLGDGESFVEFLQTERDRTWIPQVRAAAMAADREYVSACSTS